MSYLTDLPDDRPFPWQLSYHFTPLQLVTWHPPPARGPRGTYIAGIKRGSS